jgi:CRP-like cAMP-binding protein
MKFFHRFLPITPAELIIINLCLSSRDHIAHYAGTATESLIRTLSDFKAEKLIEIKEEKIVVSNLDKLKNLLY